MGILARNPNGNSSVELAVFGAPTNLAQGQAVVSNSIALQLAILNDLQIYGSGESTIRGGGTIFITLDLNPSIVYVINTSTITRQVSETFIIIYP